MRIRTDDNADPRWDDETLKAIGKMVDAAMARAPRLELAWEGGAATPEERRQVLLSSFREFAKGTSVDHLLTTPPGLLEQFSVLALTRNHNIKGELVQLIRVFVMAYSDPELHLHACQALADLEGKVRAQFAEKGPPSWADQPFKPMPGSPATMPPMRTSH